LTGGPLSVTLAAMNAAILLVAALATSDAPAPTLDASVDDVTELQGTWEVVEVMVDGDDYSDGHRGDLWTFAGDELRRPGSRHRISAGTTRLDSIDDAGVVRPGVYRIDGDRLVWTRKRVVINFRRVPR
jgi:hypothetical protein